MERLLAPGLLVLLLPALTRGEGRRANGARTRRFSSRWGSLTGSGVCPGPGWAPERWKEGGGGGVGVTPVGTGTRYRGMPGDRAQLLRGEPELGASNGGRNRGRNRGTGTELGGPEEVAGGGGGGGGTGARSRREAELGTGGCRGGKALAAVGGGTGARGGGEPGEVGGGEGGGSRSSGTGSSRRRGAQSGRAPALLFRESF